MRGHPCEWLGGERGLEEELASGGSNSNGGRVGVGGLANLLAVSISQRKDGEQWWGTVVISILLLISWKQFGGEYFFLCVRGWTCDLAGFLYSFGLVGIMVQPTIRVYLDQKHFQQHSREKRLFSTRIHIYPQFIISKNYFKSRD